MNQRQLKAIADAANMIVNGYAFTQDPNGTVRVLNLHDPSRASLFSAEYELLETSMDDIEAKIVRDYLLDNAEFLAA